LEAQVALGEWRAHLPYHFAEKVMLYEDKVFCSSTGGLFYYNLSDNSVETISKADGLSDNGIAVMEYYPEKQVAMLVYEDANIDLLKGDDIINIPDIMKKQIPGDKQVYDILFQGNKAYLSTGFGIVVVDIERYEITETYYIGENGDQVRVNQLATDGTYFYAATESGIMRAETSNPYLIDYNSWEKVSDVPYPDGFYKGVVYYSNRLFLIYQNDLMEVDEIYYYDGTWKSLSEVANTSCYEVRISNDQLVFTLDGVIKIMNEDFLFVREYESGSPKSAFLHEDGSIWVADNGRGLVEVEAGTGAEKVIAPNGPYYSLAYRMASAGGILYCVPGGVTTTYNNTFRLASVMRFKDELWRSNINTDRRDFIALAVDPEDPNHVFAASWGYGLVEYSDNTPVAFYDESNSTLRSIIPDANYIRIGGLAFDSEGNLWMTNTGVAEPISVLKKDGSWKSYKVGDILASTGGALGEIVIAENDQIWGIIPKGGGLFALDFNGTLDDETDDTYKLVNVEDENGKVITNEVFSMAEDLNGNLWLGTNQGILVYYSPENLFTNGSIIAQEILVPRDDGYGDILLKTEKITSIEVDGSNRKWIGTADGGAFLVSSNGINQIYNFNTSTSPILSNSITDICVDGKSGEVFFGTDKGIISFKGDATDGASEFSNVKVFPNPVREDYSGPISITGLLAETIVKITDMGGNLVNELESSGGLAVWDGNDLHGNRVATGVYLVFLVNKVPTKAHVTKILFIH